MITPDQIQEIAYSLCPSWFSPRYILETQPDATSLIVRIWEFIEGKWIEIDLDFSADHPAPEATKIKYFIKGKDLHIFMIDRSRSYANHATTKTPDIAVQGFSSNDK